VEINNAECKNKETAISILQTIAGNQGSYLQKHALIAVADWIKENGFRTDPSMTLEGINARILEIETELKNCMSDEERRAMIAFYCGIPPDRDFNIVILPPGSDCMPREGGNHDK